MSVSIILVRPQMGENIGAAARAMVNFGYSDLRLVAPRDGWPNARAIDMGSGAFDKIPAPLVFESLQDAAADLHILYATTARPRDMVKPVFTPGGAAKDAHKRVNEGQKIGLVFGPERTGLENEELMVCQSIISIPTNPEFPSLNLAQSVLLSVSALGLRERDEAQAVLAHGDSAPVTQDKLEEFLVRLEDELQSGGFFKSEGLKPTMIKNIRAIYTRADLSDQEVKTLHGIVSALIGQKKKPL